MVRDIRKRIKINEKQNVHLCVRKEMHVKALMCKAPCGPASTSVSSRLIHQDNIEKRLLHIEF